MKKVLIIVDGGVADYTSEDGVDVRIFDYDNWKEGSKDDRDYMRAEMWGLEHITPDWITDIVNGDDDDE